jgi:Na+/melibiose symporter-like transporter
MKVQYRITEDDYAGAARFHAWRHFIARPTTMMLVACGIVMVLLGISLWTRALSAQMLVFTIVVVSILFAFGLFVRTPNRARRHYRQYKAIQELITADLTDAGIRFSNSDGEAILPWSKVFQWRQNKQLILIYGMPILYYIVPKSIQREGFDIPLLIQCLTEHVGTER